MSHVGQSGSSRPDYEKLWGQLKEKVISGADAATEIAATAPDERRQALLIGFAVAMTSVHRAMEDGEQLGSIETALSGTEID